MYMSDTSQDKRVGRLPPWLKRPMPSGKHYAEIQKLLDDGDLHTVCSSAHCPNLGQCWSCGTATFMILGATCTRKCAFCAIDTGDPEPPADDEPQRLANAAAKMKLKHVVVTSVTRDDLPDEGAQQFADTILAIRTQLPKSTIEVLTPDFHCRHDCLDTVCNAHPDVFNHNVETVRALTPTIRPQADYDRSLSVLKYVHSRYDNIKVKSGIMVGLGETLTQIRQTIKDLAETGCSIITAGQYLAPSKHHHPVEQFYEPQWFDDLTDWAKQYLPKITLYAAPFVRSSYLAEKLYHESQL